MNIKKDIDQELEPFIQENPFNAFATVLELEGIITPPSFGGNCYTLAKKFAAKLKTATGIETEAIHAADIFHTDLIYDQGSPIYISPTLHMGKSIDLGPIEDSHEIQYEGTVPDKPNLIIVLKDTSRFSISRYSFSLDHDKYLTRSTWEFPYPLRKSRPETLHNTHNIVFNQSPNLVARFMISPTIAIIIKAKPSEGTFTINVAGHPTHDFESYEGQKLLTIIAQKSNIPISKIRNYFHTAIDIFKNNYSADQA